MRIAALRHRRQDLAHAPTFLLDAPQTNLRASRTRLYANMVKGMDAPQTVPRLGRRRQCAKQGRGSMDASQTVAGLSRRAGGSTHLLGMRGQQSCAAALEHVCPQANGEEAGGFSARTLLAARQHQAPQCARGVEVLQGRPRPPNRRCAACLRWVLETWESCAAIGSTRSRVGSGSVEGKVVKRLGGVSG